MVVVPFKHLCNNLEGFATIHFYELQCFVIFFIEETLIQENLMMFNMLFSSCN
jgi:hypothetical protein